MLTDLRIRRLGVIDEASVDLASGLTVVTGETGAGKTMVVTGLGLLLGQRADTGLIRSGSRSARVEGTWLPVVDSVAAVAEELGAEWDDDGLVTVREVASNGSRAYVGGARVPNGKLAEVASAGLTIHGQSEQVRLASSERQREVLDACAGPQMATLLERYRAVHQECRTVQAERDRLRQHAQERARELDMLRFSLDEIAAVEPQPGEDADLHAETVRLQATDDLRQAAAEASMALAGDDTGEDPGAMGRLGRAREVLGRAARDDATLADLASRAGELSHLANDLASEVASYLAGLEADPQRLEWIAARQADLAKLTRKYGEDVDAVLAWAATSAQRVAELDGDDTRIDELDARAEALQQQLQQLADEVTVARQEAAADLAEAATSELAALAMPHARISFEIERIEPGPSGQDRVQLMFTANPGSTPGPLGKVASGGELSRVRLALEVVLAERSGSAHHTFVFDEVDAGVGGAVATEIGRRLSRLARTAQVIVVTHLAQVAAFADLHLVVAKASDGQVTSSQVRRVADRDRSAELARMMGGTQAEVALAHAEELLAAAQASRDRHGADS
ncbi:DNA repair protein RecN [Parenemella sanctibonifatiensis]|uniref:DNA repair protein RecN n=1 Tax=Parenemella sanctibonifatiensis TaxID=2016505 RepID=A0A255EFH5_9ACTN|nr:DNA repair protein RecN [Parenemella sanctibonifatiensis]OYN90010.1 DNA repair protein RecN [Parenemella sanctibonifatiensis]